MTAGVQKALPWLACVLVGYLCGCLLMAKLVSAAKRTDITKSGTGNLGASNAAIHFGPALGALVAAWDISKAFLPALAMGPSRTCRARGR